MIPLPDSVPPYTRTFDLHRQSNNPGSPDYYVYRTAKPVAALIHGLPAGTTEADFGAIEFISVGIGGEQEVAAPFMAPFVIAQATGVNVTGPNRISRRRNAVAPGDAVLMITREAGTQIVSAESSDPANLGITMSSDQTAASLVGTGAAGRFTVEVTYRNPGENQNRTMEYTIYAYQSWVEQVVDQINNSTNEQEEVLANLLNMAEANNDTGRQDQKLTVARFWWDFLGHANRNSTPGASRFRPAYRSVGRMSRLELTDVVIPDALDIAHAVGGGAARPVFNPGASQTSWARRPRLEEGSLLTPLLEWTACRESFLTPLAFTETSTLSDDAWGLTQMKTASITVIPGYDQEDLAAINAATELVDRAWRRFYNRATREGLADAAESLANDPRSDPTFSLVLTIHIFEDNVNRTLFGPTINADDIIPPLVPPDEATLPAGVGVNAITQGDINESPPVGGHTDASMMRQMLAVSYNGGIGALLDGITGAASPDTWDLGDVDAEPHAADLSALQLQNLQAARNRARLYGAAASRLEIDPVCD